MALQRKEHWDTEAFDQFLRARAPMPFVWGQNDCSLFPADAIEAITGTDIAAEFRGKYSDYAGALAAIKAVCGGTTVADAASWCATRFGLVELAHPLKAQRGDLVTIEDAGRMIAGIVGLSGNVAAVGATGLMQIPITAVLRAWHY